MKGAPVGVLQAAPRRSRRSPAGTAAAANQVPVVVTNDGDAPLAISAPSPLAADAHDGGNATRGDFAIVSQNCSAHDARPGPAGRGRRPDDAGRQRGQAGRPRRAPARSTSASSRRAPNYTSVARLQFTSNSDDAMDRVLLAGTSTDDALGTVGGDVPSMLRAEPAARSRGSFGTFVPAVGHATTTRRWPRR